MKRDANGYKLHQSGKKTWKNSNDEYHRTDGPAVDDVNGHKAWYFNGQLHCTDGPAVQYANGNKYWYFNDKCHRTDGPAVQLADGYKEYWYKGKQIAEEVFYSDEFQIRMVMES